MLPVVAAVVMLMLCSTLVIAEELTFVEYLRKHAYTSKLANYDSYNNNHSLLPGDTAQPLRDQGLYWDSNFSAVSCEA